VGATARRAVRRWLQSCPDHSELEPHHASGQSTKRHPAQRNYRRHHARRAIA